MKLEFLAIIKRAKAKYDFRLENFCILGSSYHLIIQPKNGASLSRIMQWIMSVFAMRFNRLQGHWGHVWGDRFRSRIIRGLGDLLAAFDAIDRSPQQAGLTNSLMIWPWNGLSHHRRADDSLVDRLPDWLQRFVPHHRARFWEK